MKHWAWEEKNCCHTLTKQSPCGWTSGLAVSAPENRSEKFIHSSPGVQNHDVYTVWRIGKKNFQKRIREARFENVSVPMNIFELEINLSFLGFNSMLLPFYKLSIRYYILNFEIKSLKWAISCEVFGPTYPYCTGIWPKAARSCTHIPVRVWAISELHIDWNNSR